MSNPIEDFGKEMLAHMKNVSRANTGVTVELGTINSNMSLSVASLGNAIPKGDYMISLHLRGGNEVQTSSVSLNTETEEGHKHSISGHSHTVTLPGRLRGLNAGDRVIVAWVGTEPVVVDIVVSS